jgi:hypothetical protein
MRLKSADQSMITDVSRLHPHLCMIITSTAPAEIVGEDVELWRPSLTRDIRAKTDAAATRVGAVTDAIGSTLLRSQGNIRPVQ